MRVKELIELLQREDPRRLVVVQKDAGGNGYSPLDGIWTGMYRADTAYGGEAGLQKLTDEDRAAGYGEEDVLEGEPALMLFPVE